MSALTFLEEFSAKPISKLGLAFFMICFLSACGAGGGESNDSVVVDSQTTTETEEQTPVQVAPVQILTNPQDLTLDTGAAAVFSVSATGGGELSFQWRKNQQNIQGAVASTLTVTNVSSADGGLYDVVVSNSEGNESSLSALLTINPPVVIQPIINPVVITSQPQSMSVDENAAASFSVQVTGDGEITYQWLKNGVTVNGANSSSLSFSDVGLENQGAYSVRVANSQNTLVSSVANLTVSLLPQAVTITSQPQSVSVDENASASFSVQVTGDGDITYQWLKDGEAIMGATSSSYNVSTATQVDAADYSVRVTNSRGSVFSSVASLNVTPVQVLSSIELTWDIPQQREDGSDLEMYEINGYVIVYGTDENDLSNQLAIDGGQTTNTILEQLSSGTYYFSIATVDSDGIQGAYSDVIQQSI